MKAIITILPNNLQYDWFTEGENPEKKLAREIRRINPNAILSSEFFTAFWGVNVEQREHFGQFFSEVLT